MHRTNKWTGMGQAIGQEGFTLIEIIAVLVILSILAVVAVPKYFDLQQEAQQKAMDAAMSEAVSRVNGKFAQALLGGSAPADITYDGNTLGTDLGDFVLTIVPQGGSSLSLQVAPRPGTAVQNASTVIRVIPIPGNV